MIDSDALGISAPLRHVLLPVVMRGVFLALCLEHLFVVWILVRLLFLPHLVLSLAFQRVRHLAIRELFQRHGGQVVAWLEHLLLVLLLQVHAIVNVLVSNLDSIDWLVLAHWVDVF